MEPCRTFPGFSPINSPFEYAAIFRVPGCKYFHVKHVKVAPGKPGSQFDTPHGRLRLAPSSATFVKCASLRVSSTMKLSPEARQLVEEKARLEGPKPQQEPAIPMKPQLLRLVWPLLVVFGLVFVVSVFVVQQSPEKQAADENAKLHYEICKGRLKQAKELDVLSDLNAKGSSIKVTVGPAFFTVPIDTQQEFARTVNCFLVKGAGRGVSFDLIHWQTGKKVASWKGDRLDVD